MPRTVLLTAAKEDTEYVLSCLTEKNRTVLHTPLETYVERTDEAQIKESVNRLKDFENVVYGSKRNARFFISCLKRFDKMDAVKERLNIAFDEATFQFLEGHGIAAVHPQNGSKAIDVMEMMLRLKRLGDTLYPCGSLRREDLPGLLEELDMPVSELILFDLKGPEEQKLTAYQKEVSRESPEVIIFHSRSSVTRTLAAFPDVDYENAKIISADPAISNKLEEKGIAVDEQGGGSWNSILELI